MAYSPKSQKDYNDKCKRVTLKYTEKETSEYERLVKYCNDNNFKITVYIKSLIKADLDSKGVSYIDAGDGSKNNGNC